jgi:hypothetical protein
MTREEAITELLWRMDCYDDGANIALGMAIAALREQEEYEGLKNSYDQLQASFDVIFESNQKMGEAFRRLLNEKIERSKGCEHCNGKQKPLPCIDGYSSFNVIEYNAEGKPVLNDADGCDIWIKFCPMCGRKLEVE